MGYCVSGYGLVSIKDEHGLLAKLNEHYGINKCSLLEATQSLGMFVLFPWKERYGVAFDYLKWHCDDEEEFLKLISPYVDNGEIEMSGEDDTFWVYRFRNGKVYEHNGSIVYEEKGTEL